MCLEYIFSFTLDTFYFPVILKAVNRIKPILLILDSHQADMVLNLTTLCPHFNFRTRKNPKSGIRPCSNRYTEYPVREVNMIAFFVCLIKSRLLCICVGVFVFLSVFVYEVTLCSVSPSPCSEVIEENPYRPTYIFPENYDIHMKSKGIRWQ